MTEHSSSRPARVPLPQWFRNQTGKSRAFAQLSRQLAHVPHSVCQEAKCPNRGECWSRGTLTFMILGTQCTRHCRFCNVTHNDHPDAVPDQEISHILDSIRTLGIKFVVITSPTRDDLADGGASVYAAAITRIKSEFPATRVEVLIPDFEGRISDLKTVMAAGPDVLNHNIEMVRDLYPALRRGAEYDRSLQLLKNIKYLNPAMRSKTGLMVGLGETQAQLTALFSDVAGAGVEILTIGQYLKPSGRNAEVVRYYTPDEFENLKIQALQAGIKTVFSGPLVRSSYLADSVFETVERTFS